MPPNVSTIGKAGDLVGPQRTVMVVGTGGTIAQAGSREATISVSELAAAVSTQATGGLVVCSEQAFQLTSPNVTPQHWSQLTLHTKRLLADREISGVVVTHGTDTLEETAFFLHLATGSEKPVVVVGSMRPTHSDQADGPRNLRNAIVLAASQEAVGMGVLVTLSDRIESARDVTKMHTNSLDAFRSPNSGPLGHIAGSHVVFERFPTKRRGPLSAFASFGGEPLPKVDIIYGYAGVGPEYLMAALSNGAAGIIFAGTGDGSIPTALEEPLMALRRAGVSIVRSSRTNGGTVSRNGEVDDDRLGSVAAGNLNPQKARVLLMLALLHTSDPVVVQKLFDQH